MTDTTKDIDEACEKDRQSERARPCDTCGYYGEAWAVWSDSHTNFKWQCDTCRHNPTTRNN